MNKIYTTTIIFLVSFGTFAQDRGRQNHREYRPSVSFGVQVAQPLGDFASLYDGNPAGLSGQLVVPIEKSPFQVGVSASWNAMARKHDDIMVYIGEDVDGVDFYEDGHIVVKSNNHRYLAIGRFSPFKGNFQLYGEALGGLETFSTKTAIAVDGETYSESGRKEKHQWDIGLTGGWAAGIKIGLTDDLFLEARFEKLQGGKISFVDPDSVEIGEEGELEYSTVEPNADKFTVQAGLSLQF